MAEGFNRPTNPNQKPPTALSEYNLRLTGEPINGSKRPPSLMVNVKRDGKQGPWTMYFEARTGVEDDKDYGKITLLADMPTTFMILDLIAAAAENAAAGKEPDSNRVEIHSRRFIRAQNAMSKEPMLDGTLTIGHTANGQVFVGITSWDSSRPKCKFVLKPVVDYRRAVRLFRKDGSPWEDGPLSQLYARNWARGMGEILSQAFLTEFVAPPPREQGQGGGNNYGGNRGGGGGYSGGNKEPAASSGGWDDEIPM